MTTLTELRALALAATQPHDDSSHAGFTNCETCLARIDLRAALSPKRVLQLLDVIEAAKAMRADPTYRSGHLQAFDTALAKLEQK